MIDLTALEALAAAMPTGMWDDQTIANDEYLSESEADYLLAVHPQTVAALVRAVRAAEVVVSHPVSVEAMSAMGTLRAALAPFREKP